MRLSFKLPALVLILGALFGSITAATSDQKPPVSQTHTVVIRGFQFTPTRLEVAAGDTVIWKNEDIVPHTAKRVFDSKNLDNGQSWIYVTKKKGTFPYICTYHPTMKAELVIK